jgi:hypothetical protein
MNFDAALIGAAFEVMRYCVGRDLPFPGPLDRQLTVAIGDDGKLVGVGEILAGL